MSAMFIALVERAPSYTQAPHTSMPKKPNTRYWGQTLSTCARLRHNSAPASRQSTPPASAHRAVANM